MKEVCGRRMPLPFAVASERQLVKAVKARFRALSDPQRQEVPALLNAIGKLEMAAGNYEEAHQDFRQVATMVR